MVLVDLLPEIRSLSRGDKLRLLQLLAADVAREESILGANDEIAPPLWSPYDEFEGAAELLNVLKANHVSS